MVVCFFFLRIKGLSYPSPLTPICGTIAAVGTEMKGITGESLCYRAGGVEKCVSVFFFSFSNFLVGQAGADKGEPVVSRHIADFWQNSPSSRKFTHFLAPGQAVLVGLGVAFPSVRKMVLFLLLFFPLSLLSLMGQGMESACVLGQGCRKESKVWVQGAVPRQEGLPNGHGDAGRNGSASFLGC